MLKIFYFIALSWSKNEFKAKHCLKFEDNFDTFDLSKWKHDITLSGGGNWEFQYYSNNRTNSFVKDGKLHLYPTLTSDHFGQQAFETNLEVNLWGSEPANQCTGNNFFGCQRSSVPGAGILVNPIQSALIRSINSVSLKRGRVEVRAKIPEGDWLWPAIWLLPKDQQYGNWPASGEIDLLESRGNRPERYGGGEGNNVVRSTLHWGPSYEYNQYQLTSEARTLDNSHDGYHIYSLEINDQGIQTFVDGKPILTVSHTNPRQAEKTVFMPNGYWDYGKHPKSLNNPWGNRPRSAPFDQEFYLIMNLAVGGTNGYFPDGVGPKPWVNNYIPNNSAQKQFWDNRGSWLPTWKDDLSRAFSIDYVKVFDAC